MKSHRFAFVPSTILVLSTLCLAACSGDPAAFGDSENVDATNLTFDEFKSMIYQEPDTGIYIVDGDTPILSERELEQFYLRFVQEGALIVSQSGGVDAKWDDVQKLNITYCVSSSSFGNNYNAVVDAMNSATAAWEGAANVNFVHDSSQDSNCTANNGNVVFDVRQTSGQNYLARAFFPNQSRSSRNVLIDTSSFGNISPYTLAGILRHELGHTLGFRHEHTRPESGTCFEDNNWRTLTTYDAASVMHYPQCNGTQTGDLTLTAKDTEGAVALYGAPGGAPTCAHDKCATGSPLNASACGSTVAAVCAADSYCCSTAWDNICVGEVFSIGGNVQCSTGSCAHPLCSTGGSLANGCDSNGVVAAVCAADSYCCTTAWDSICVGEVGSVAGKTCSE